MEVFKDIEDRNERAEMLVYYADKYEEVSAKIATRPYPEDKKVPYCESQAYVWVENPEGDILNFHFAIENPHGISAKALASILKNMVSGSSAKEVLDISPDIVYTIFGNDLGMVRAEGLRGMVKMIRAYAQQYENKKKLLNTTNLKL